MIKQTTLDIFENFCINWAFSQKRSFFIKLTIVFCKAKINQLKYELIDYPLYSPNFDLTSSKNQIRGSRRRIFCRLSGKSPLMEFINWRNVGINKCILSFWKNLLNNKYHFKPLFSFLFYRLIEEPSTVDNRKLL